MNGKEKQIQYSKNQITQAFFQLMKQYTYAEITVNEILDLSQISRRTFYRYFANKDEVLEYYFDELLKNYMLLEEDILAQNTFQDMLLVTLDFFLKNKEKLAILIQRQKFHLLLDKYNQSALTIYQNMQAPWHVTNTESLEDTVRFIVGGYFNIISSWLVEEDPHPAADIGKHIQQLFSTIGRSFDI